MLKKQLKTKKPKMPDQACANGLQLHDISTGFTEHIAIGEKSDFSMNPIHNNTSS